MPQGGILGLDSRLREIAYVQSEKCICFFEIHLFHLIGSNAKFGPGPGERTQMEQEPIKTL